MSEPTKYWFPAKRYGWGRGFPITWQGWLVVACFSVAAVAGVFLFPPESARLAFFAHNGCISLALLAVCYVKGEPPTWRSGKK